MDFRRFAVSPIAVCAAASLLAAACSTFQPPKGYVPDDKVVFLKEKLEYGPISYPEMSADPYSFKPYEGAIDAEKPGFLKAPSFESFLAPDYQGDSRLYKEVEAHLRLMSASKAYAELRGKLDGAKIAAEPPLPPDRGTQTKTYTNGAEYEYPGAAGGTITVLDGGEYRIDFPDQGRFVSFPDGSYERKDPSGKLVSAYYKRDSSFVITEGDSTFTVIGDFKRVESPLGKAEYSIDPSPQYHFTPPGSSLVYTFFVDKEGGNMELSVSSPAGLRFDYLVKDESVLVTSGSRAIDIGKDFEKRQTVFDTKTNKATDLLSAYLPEGLRMANLSGPGLGYSELKPKWPEGYLSKTIGPFTVFYTAKDEGLLKKIDAGRLARIEESDRRITGMSVTPGRSIVIPPDLSSYCRLHAREKGSKLKWYPSGFETQDYIVMWPISVPRYKSPEGQDYFFGEELPEIVAHEYVHLMVGENAGILSPVPVWLNEGLAVYVESQVSAESKAYWDLSFSVARERRQLLDWDSVAVHGTGDFPVVQARVHYAQSYALVGALVAKFGPAKLAEYVKSFRVKPEDIAKTDLKVDYRSKFKSVFGTSFEEALPLIAKSGK